VLPTPLRKTLQQGIELQGKGRLGEAAECYARVRASAPADFDAWHYGGMAALLLGRADEAAALLERALQLKPASLQTTFGLGVANVARGELAAAEQLLSAVTTKDPKLADGWNYLGLVFQMQGRFDEAIAARKRVVTLKPKHAPGWADLGSTLSLVGRQTEALDSFNKALANDPKHQGARLGRAMVLFKCHRVKEAVDEYGAVLAKDPAQFQARSFRLMALNSMPEITREQIFAEHVSYGEAAGNAVRSSWPNSTVEGKRLRVGFLSADFREHSVAYFIEPLLRHLNSSFEVVLYHDHPQIDAVSERLRQLAAAWRHVAGRTDAMLESMILADAPDLLIDLGGHTGMSRLRVFTRRAAPIQLTYLGYPNTTGVRAMDYRLVDAVTDPEPTSDAFATEKLVRFAPTAWAYQPPQDAPDPGPMPELSSGHITFGAFNNFTKVTDDTLRLWARVLAAVPGSRLLLKAEGLAEAVVGEPVRARLRAAGIADGQVELLSRTPDTLSHLSLYRRVDIALDTFPYHGTTTTCEALWMGAPVVTLVGDRHASRVGLSLLNAIGRAEWAAATAEDYERIAVELASDAPKRAALRTTLRDELRRSPLLDHAGQSVRFATALRGCWENWRHRLI
jgi:predicted O-linked N-acetylglucosamine transferase (SPINDLY family)